MTKKNDKRLYTTNPGGHLVFDFDRIAADDHEGFRQRTEFISWALLVVCIIMSSQIVLHNSESNYQGYSYFG